LQAQKDSPNRPARRLWAGRARWVSQTQYEPSVWCAAISESLQNGLLLFAAVQRNRVAGVFLRGLQSAGRGVLAR
jgi:hypothetical protein